VRLSWLSHAAIATVLKPPGPDITAPLADENHHCDKDTSSSKPTACPPIALTDHMDSHVSEGLFVAIVIHCMQFLAELQLVCLTGSL